MTGHIGAFEVVQPLPEMKRPRLIMSLSPWIDVGSVGTIALTVLERELEARPLAQLARPGDFYDFTRYRPTLRREEGRRYIETPNTAAHYARGPDGDDWILLHVLEPHAHAEEYLDSLAELMAHFGVGHVCLIGSFYGPAPHTRPLLVFGDAGSPSLQDRLRDLGLRESTYEGPTTILAAVTEQADEQGMETVRLIMQLPAYAQLEQDYRGAHAMIELLGRLYGVSADLATLAEEAERQTAALADVVSGDPRLQRWVKELEETYDQAQPSQPAEPGGPELSPELERFLQDIQRGMTDPDR